MKNFKKLYVWSRAMDFTTSIYKLTGSFPIEERYGIISQMKRSAVSIPSNISEGSGRRTNADQARFMNIALGSSFELETQILLSKQLGYAKPEEADEALNELTFIQVALSKYITTLRNRESGMKTAGIIGLSVLAGWMMGLGL
jgi:four helix bundle protein